HPTDWLGRCPFGTSYIPRSSRVHVVCMPTRSPPVHTTAPTSAYPGHYPRPSLLGRSRLMTRHTADHLLAKTCRPTRGSCPCSLRINQMGHLPIAHLPPHRPLRR